jgi:hypothetical protein
MSAPLISLPQPGFRRSERVLGMMKLLAGDQAERFDCVVPLSLRTSGISDDNCELRNCLLPAPLTEIQPIKAAMIAATIKARVTIKSSSSNLLIGVSPVPPFAARRQLCWHGGLVGALRRGHCRSNEWRSLVELGCQRIGKVLIPTKIAV